MNHEPSPARRQGSSEPWETRFGFFWYNDQEIFRDTRGDLAAKAGRLAEAGINHVITFSCTHFRWSFRPWWDLLTERLALIVEVCHEHGILVTEHHSCHLTFNPLDEAEEGFMERVLRVRGSALASWPGLREACDADPLLEGVRLSSMRQIDGRTGNWARSSYRGWCMCFNNPDFRRLYCSYLATLYKVGIDGIMTDDVQWFGQKHACACRHCRQLFAAETGYELPPPGAAWEQWHGHHEDPSYTSWLAFRLRSNERFHQAIADHYRALGLRPLRPNYVSTALNSNPTAYTLDALPDLDWVFQECCFSTIIRYSWPHWAVEAMHRYAVGRRRGIPSMAMFYPDRPDTMLFTWALALSWGGMYLATPEGHSLERAEKQLRQFERRHASWLQAPRRIARLGFYDSRRNRSLYGRAEERSMAQLKVWLQACYRHNLPCDLFQQEELERLVEYDVVVLNEVALLSDSELAAFRGFVDRGGSLVWCGACGAVDEHGVKREAGWEERWLGRRLPEPASLSADGEQVRVGNGSLQLLPADVGLLAYEPAYNADRWRAEEVRVPYQRLGDEGRKQRRWIVEWLSGLLPKGSRLRVEGLPEDVQVTLFERHDGNGVAVHLVNASGTLEPPAGGTIGHGDPIPAVQPTTGQACLYIRTTPGRHVHAVTWLEPDAEPRPVLFQPQQDGVDLILDPAWLGTYALLAVEYSQA